MEAGHRGKNGEFPQEVAIFLDPTLLPRAQVNQNGTYSSDRGNPSSHGYRATDEITRLGGSSREDGEESPTIPDLPAEPPNRAVSLPHDTVGRISQPHFGTLPGATATSSIPGPPHIRRHRRLPALSSGRGTTPWHWGSPVNQPEDRSDLLLDHRSVDLPQQVSTRRGPVSHYQAASSGSNPLIQTSVQSRLSHASEQKRWGIVETGGEHDDETHPAFWRNSSNQDFGKDEDCSCSDEDYSSCSGDEDEEGAEDPHSRQDRRSILRPTGSPGSITADYGGSNDRESRMSELSEMPGVENWQGQRQEWQTDRENALRELAKLNFENK